MVNHSHVLHSYLRNEETARREKGSICVADLRNDVSAAAPSCRAFRLISSFLQVCRRVAELTVFAQILCRLRHRDVRIPRTISHFASFLLSATKVGESNLWHCARQFLDRRLSVLPHSRKAVLHPILP